MSERPSSAKIIDICVPPEGFTCTSDQQKKVWKLNAWLYGLRKPPRGWWGTLHDFLIEIGFHESAAEAYLYNMNDGEVLLLVYVNDILLSGDDEDSVMSIVEELAGRFDTVDLGGLGSSSVWISSVRGTPGPLF